MAAGAGWRSHCWSRARRDLLPQLPLEVIRLRVARARELGLDYRTYANVRATSGCDIVAFLFSSNALRLIGPADVLPEERARKLAGIGACGRILLAQPPLDPTALASRIAVHHGIDFAGAAPAPRFPGTWRAMRDGLRAALDACGVRGEGALLVGDTGFEREWAEAARLAGYLPAQRYFPEADS